jgi:hypothetical protein
VFTRSGTTWAQQQKLVASDPAIYDNFGSSVSLDGDTALIGKWKDSYSASDSGAAYIFIRSDTTWTQQGKLLASDGSESDYFGAAVSLDGDTALIGAWGDDNWSRTCGSAYIFTRSGTTWTQQQKLLPSDPGDGDFGFSVSLDGDTAFIAAPYDGDLGIYSGSVYVFTKEENHPPLNPTITGPTSGKIKVAIEYNFTTTDPDSDNVSYYIDWGDGTNSRWVGPYTSGEEITQSHIWTKKGDYTIKAKAKDINGAESNWTTLEVTIPRNRAIDNQILRFFEDHPLLYKIFQLFFKQL